MKNLLKKLGIKIYWEYAVLGVDGEYTDRLFIETKNSLAEIYRRAEK